ncbi:MAG: hypothetical protein ACOYEW_08565 [Anaerolineae bacterium]
MNKPGTKSILLGAVLGGAMGALLGAIIATRRSSRNKVTSPSVTDITSIGMTALALTRQIIDAFS